MLKLKLHSAGVRRCQYTRDGAKVVSCSSDCGVKVREGAGGRRKGGGMKRCILLLVLVDMSQFISSIAVYLPCTVLFCGIQFIKAT